MLREHLRDHSYEKFSVSLCHLGFGKGTILRRLFAGMGRLSIMKSLPCSRPAIPGTYETGSQDFVWNSNHVDLARPGS